MEIVSIKQYFFRGEAKISEKKMSLIKSLSKQRKLQIEIPDAFDVKAGSCFAYIF